MTWKRDQEEEIIATREQMRRFGITKNFDVDRNDPTPSSASELPSGTR